MKETVQTASDKKFMRRAILLAQRGAGWVNPNPMVGAVLVKNGRITGEGYHEYFGGDHAEVNAIRNAGRKAKGSTLYVTLEPCSHHGKTPPCTDLIIKTGITRVVVGITDPNPLVNGKGIEKLREAGISVVQDVLEAECRKLNEVFIKYIKTGMPFGLLKTAMTLDGKIATITNASRWISGEASRSYVHELRHSLGAIMVGINTVIYDNPLLNVRGKVNARNPVKVIVDTHGRTPKDARIMQNDPQLTIIATTSAGDATNLKDLERLGAQVIVCPEKDGKVDLEYLFMALAKMGIDSVLIEGGSTLSFSLIRERLVDKILTFIAPKIIGGKDAASPVGGEGIERMEDAVKIEKLNYRKIGEDILVEGYIMVHDS